MTLTHDHLQIQLDAARAGLAALDINAARAHAQKAQRTRDDLDALTGHSAPMGAPGHDPAAKERADTMAQASRAAKAARSAVLAMEDRATQLQAEIEYLSKLLDSSAAVDRARAGVEAVAGLVAAAEQKVAKAERDAKTIEDMIGQAEREFDAARTTAAAQLLEAVKTGGDAAAVPAATRDRITTLEMARDSAAQELAAARAALQALAQRRKAAAHEVRIAEAAAADLAHAMVMPAYVQTLGEHIAAHIRAHKQQPPIHDLMSRAHAIAQALLQADPA